MKKFLLGLFAAFVIATAIPSPALAATPTFSFPKIKADAFGIFLKHNNRTRLFFVPLLSVKNVSYTLSYESDGVPQGVTGSFDVNKKMIVIRDVPLETCSGVVCVEHKKITNMNLSATFTYKDNSTSTETVTIQTY